MAGLIWFVLWSVILDEYINKEETKAKCKVIMILGIIVFAVCFIFFLNRTYKITDVKDAEYKYVDNVEIYYYTDGELRNFDCGDFFCNIKYHLSDTESSVTIYEDDKPSWVNIWFFVPDKARVDVYVTDPVEYNKLKEELNVLLR